MSLTLTGLGVLGLKGPQEKTGQGTSGLFLAQLTKKGQEEAYGPRGSEKGVCRGGPVRLCLPLSRCPMVFRPEDASRLELEGPMPQEPIC